MTEFKVGDILIAREPRKNLGVCLVVNDQDDGTKFLWLPEVTLSRFSPEMFEGDIVLGNIRENLEEFVEALQKLKKDGGSGT